MNKYTFTINGRLSGLNELIGANRSGWQAGAGIKRRNQRIVTDSILISGRKEFSSPVCINIHWYEPNKKRDPDNIFSGVKFILDAMVEMNIIPDDSQKYVQKINNELFIDKDNPRIVVTIEGM